MKEEELRLVAEFVRQHVTRANVNFIGKSTTWACERFMFDKR